MTGMEHGGRPVGAAAVMGAGAWGTAFAKVLVDAGTPTVLWSRRPELAAEINDTGRNGEYLPDVKLPPERTDCTFSQARRPKLRIAARPSRMAPA